MPTLNNSNIIHMIANGIAFVSILFLANVTIVSAQTVKDIDGNIYKTVTIDKQVWMKENLKVTRYNNGDSIKTTNPAGLDVSSEKTPNYQWVYEGRASNLATYGRLYSWYAVTDLRNICPAGWHVSTSAEWDKLVDLFGDDATIMLKEKGDAHWVQDNILSTNSTGFTGLPGGLKDKYGYFYFLRNQGFWWTPTSINDSDAESRNLSNQYRIAVNSRLKACGFSVRCIKN